MNCPLCGHPGEALLSSFLCSNNDCANSPAQLSPKLKVIHDRIETEHSFEPEALVSPVDPELNDQLWRQGCLFHLLDEAQQEIYEWLKAQPESVRIIVNMIARRFGKTFIYSCLAIERAIQQPGSLQHYFAMTTVQVRNMLVPVFQAVLATCPADIKPHLLQRDNTWVFPTGSRIMMLGAEDEQKCDRARGQHSDSAYVDEAGYIGCLNYLITSILTPMLHGRKDAHIYLYSNAPVSPAHDMVAFANRARDQGAYLHRTVYDSPRYSAEEIDEFAAAAGGKDSTEWRREYLAEIVVDEDHAVVPEFASRAERRWVLDPDSFRALHVGPEHTEAEIREPIIREVPRPQYYDIYTVMDLGFAPDLTFVLTGYWDYLNAWLVVEDEREESRATTDRVAGSIVDMETVRWAQYWDFIEANHGRERRPFMRVMDVNKQMQADLGILHQLDFADANNKDLDSQVNRLRQGFRHGKVVIHPRCTGLIAHLHAAYWDANRKSFARPRKKPVQGERYYGHFDAVSALQLMYSHVNKTHDPYPDIPVGISHDTHHITRRAVERRKRNQNDGIAKLARQLGSKHRRRYGRRAA